MMVYIRQFPVLLLPFLCFCLGCGNTEIDRCAGKCIQLSYEIADLLDSIQDEKTLQENSGKVISKYKELCKTAKELAGMRTTKGHVQTIRLRVQEAGEKIAPRNERNFRRIAGIPGGKEMVRSVLSILKSYGITPDPHLEVIVADHAEEMNRRTEEFKERINGPFKNNHNPSFSHSTPRPTSHPSFTKPSGGTSNSSPHVVASIPAIDLSKKAPKELIGFFAHPDPTVAVRAIQRINRVEPDSVSNDVKREVAQTLKGIAYDRFTSNQVRSAAIQGMVIWGGKYSVPLLLELLNEENVNAFQQEVILKALSDFGDYTAIEPAAKILAQGDYNMSLASEYLAKAGPDAEQVVLDHVRPTTFMLTQETVKLLGKIGTRKSFAAFKLLRKSQFYPIIKQDIDDARKAIMEREKANAT